MKVALNLNESDDESIVSSKGGSDSGEEERDLLKALAQRATDPYIKARKAKGPFVVSSMCATTFLRVNKDSPSKRSLPSRTQPVQSNVQNSMTYISKWLPS
eukprot:1159767-Pelagomonas_calceolata.AAC.5